MKRGNRQKLIGFLTRMRRERIRCIQQKRYARAREIKLWLKAHSEMLRVKDAA